MSHPSVDDGCSLSAERSSVLGVGKGLTGTHVRISEIIFLFKEEERKTTYKFHYTVCNSVLAHFSFVLKKVEIHLQVINT